LVNKAHAIAAQELSLQGENDWLTANRSGSVAKGDDRSFIFSQPRFLYAPSLPKNSA
jgi:hypothetical protein